MNYRGCSLIYARSIAELKSKLNPGPGLGKPSVVTVGNFDGLHIGHQKLLATLKSEALRIGKTETTLLTFQPHPRDFFSARSSAEKSARIFSLRERFLRVAEAGISNFVIMKFGAELAALSAAEFVSEILIGALSTKGIVVGDEWRFGKGREGDVDLLRSSGERLGFSVTSPLVLNSSGEKVSSSDLRRVLIEGDLQSFRLLSAREYELCGIVSRGEQRGQQLGFKTANLVPRVNAVTLRAGVYATKVNILGGAAGSLNAVTNIGVRPTFDSSASRTIVETHILDGFNRDIYGQRIQVTFKKWIREERKFSSAAELKRQIDIDIVAAKTFLGLIGSPP